MKRQPLTRQQVIDAIERTDGGTYTPLFMHKWWGDGLAKHYGQQLIPLEERYPDDFYAGWYTQPGYEFSNTDNPEYRFGYKESYADSDRHSIGEVVVLLPDWAELDEFLASFPDPNEPGIFDHIVPDESVVQGRYRIGCWWNVFHERFWSIRGMENLMMDYYDNMDGLKQIGRALVDFYKVILERFAALGYDGIFTSDDLGHQSGPMMSPDVFRELYYPLYHEFIVHAHSLGLHVFLHSCGDNTLLMDMLIDAGLDVFHPVQKDTMDMEQTGALFQDKITFMAGMDVQHLLPNGPPQQVRDEVRRMKRAFQTEQGGLILSAGNGILPDSPLENIEAMLDEMCQPNR